MRVFSSAPASSLRCIERVFVSWKRRLTRKKWVQRYAFQEPLQWCGVVGLVVAVFLPTRGAMLWIDTTMSAFFVLTFVVSMFCDIVLSMARTRREARTWRELFEQKKDQDEHDGYL